MVSLEKLLCIMPLTSNFILQLDDLRCWRNGCLSAWLVGCYALQLLSRLPLLHSIWLSTSMKSAFFVMPSEHRLEILLLAILCHSPCCTLVVMKTMQANTFQMDLYRTTRTMFHRNTVSGCDSLLSY
ncbi:hypothetical protein BDQ17DRAFT_1541292 [Cyathus striatus]|nr:hypothetical protein BDQ17DRAFT_1541292 [Cyathus striatus]